PAASANRHLARSRSTAIDGACVIVDAMVDEQLQNRAVERLVRGHAQDLRRGPIEMCHAPIRIEPQDAGVDVAEQSVQFRRPIVGQEVDSPRRTYPTPRTVS